jgi:hypothetical protein
MSKPRIRVRFDDPDHGWIGLSIKAEGSSDFQQSFSYTPYDSFGELIAALSQVSQGPGYASVHWNAEPVEFEFHFERAGDTARLQIERHPDHRRIKGQSSVLCSLSGTFEEIALPFWQALQNLRSRFSAEDLSKRWHRAFPGAELERLTRRLKG